jgi:hypothetical protein
VIVFTPPPPTAWKWIVFGDVSGLTIYLPNEVSWLARKTTELLLESKWERSDMNKQP